MGNGLGIGAVILGIASIGLSFVILMPLIVIIGLAVTAIILGAVGINRDDSKGPAITGLVLGIIGTFFWFIAAWIIALILVGMII
ncbi:MAG: hypothetical protein ACTSUE_06810 [Promethearchaeota archaeon]